MLEPQLESRLRVLQESLPKLELVANCQNHCQNRGQNHCRNRNGKFSENVIVNVAWDGAANISGMWGKVMAPLFMHQSHYGMSYCHNPAGRRYALVSSSALLRTSKFSTPNSVSCSFISTHILGMDQCFSPYLLNDNYLP